MLSLFHIFVKSDIKWDSKGIQKETSSDNAFINNIY